MHNFWRSKENGMKHEKVNTGDKGSSFSDLRALHSFYTNLKRGHHMQSIRKELDNVYLRCYPNY